VLLHPGHGAHLQEALFALKEKQMCFLEDFLSLYLIVLTYTLLLLFPISHVFYNTFLEVIELTMTII